MATERIYLYNLDAYIGYCDKVGPCELKFTREDTTHCWRVEKAVKQFALETAHDLYGGIVQCRTYDRNREDIQDVINELGLGYYDEWEIFVRSLGRFVNDTLWCHTNKVDGSYFWKIGHNEEFFRQEYNKLKAIIPNF